MKLAASTIPTVPNPKAGNEVGDSCVANISASGRRQRLIFGIVQLVIAIAILTGLIVTGADRLWRLPLLFVFWAAAVGFFQWRDKTCVALAKLDSREVNGVIEKIANQAELAQVRRQARKLFIEAFLAAILLTLIALALP